MLFSLIFLPLFIIIVIAVGIICVKGIIKSIKEKNVHKIIGYIIAAFACLIFPLVLLGAGMSGMAYEIPGPDSFRTVLIFTVVIPLFDIALFLFGLYLIKKKKKVIDNSSFSNE